jgi:ribosomal protein S18 acetylase RimI-like enzyme
MINIREVRNQDLPALADLYVKTYEDFDVGEKWDTSSSLELLKYWFDRQPDLAFLAEWDGKICGAFFVAVKPWWDGAHLVDGELFVDPEMQKMGIGSKLSIRIFEEAISKYNAKVWDTYTFRNSKHPLSWYKSLGFEEIKEWVMICGNLENALKRLKK